MSILNDITLTTSALRLDSFGGAMKVAIVGATGGIGSAFVEALSDHNSVERVFALSRSDPRQHAGKVFWGAIDIENEDSIEGAAHEVRALADSLHLVVVASGILHDGETLQPEKSWRGLDARCLETAFRINTIGPALVAKHFLPLLAQQPKSAFAALSARVGSISDNRLGGWHAYRASKAALNMLIRTLSIELKRVTPQALCIALHPGTVDTRLSKPFQASVPEDKLFSPTFTAHRLLTVLNALTPDHSGKVFAWDGKEIPF